MTLRSLIPLFKCRTITWLEGWFPDSEDIMIHGRTSDCIDGKLVQPYDWFLKSTLSLSKGLTLFFIFCVRLYQSISTVQTIIPLEQVISVRGCFCNSNRGKKWTSSSRKQFLCRCMIESTGNLADESTINIQDMVSGKENNNQQQPPTSPNNRILKCVNLFYAVPVGEFRWKVTSLCLSVTNNPDVTTQSHLDWVQNVTSLLNGMTFDLSLPTAPITVAISAPSLWHP